MSDEIRILLVDDEPLVQRSMEKTLLRAGFAVETAADATEGLATFRSAQEAGSAFQVAILDLNMPNLEGRDDPAAGLELLSELRALDPSLSVIVLTAFDDVSRAKEALVRGARSYVVKGREKELIELVQSIL